MTRSIIFATGDVIELPERIIPLSNDDLLIAVDGGYGHFRKFSLTPHLLIGDFDSIAGADLSEAESKGVEIIRHPTHKDKTDLQLAMEEAVTRGATEIIVLGSGGGRWDMALANIMLLAAPFLAKVDAKLMDGQQTLRCLRGGKTLDIEGMPGDLISLLPVIREAGGITLEGFEYPLNNSTLRLGETRGISNVLTGETGRVKLKEGCLLVSHICCR